jgi:hypothetical protein
MLHERVIPTAEAIAEIMTLVRRNIRMTESIMMIWIGRPTRLHVVPGSIYAFVEAAVPRL